MTIYGKHRKKYEHNAVAGEEKHEKEREKVRQR